MAEHNDCKDCGFSQRQTIVNEAQVNELVKKYKELEDKLTSLDKQQQEFIDMKNRLSGVLWITRFIGLTALMVGYDFIKKRLGL